MIRAKAEKSVVEPQHEGKLALAKPYRAFSDSIKHRLDVVRRDRDNAQDFRSRRLQLARLDQFSCENAELLRQINVGRLAKARTRRRRTTLCISSLSASRFSRLPAGRDAPLHARPKD